MEYKRKGKTGWIYQYPPRTDKDGFDDLELITLGKICELRQARRKAEQLHNKRFKALKKTSKDNLWRLVYEFEFQAEEFYINRWLKYWTRIGTDPEPKKEERGFTDSQIEQAREFPLESLFEGELRTTYNRLMGLCPFHEEKTASFVMYPDNSFHCFGCGAHGKNAIDYLQLQGVSFQEAVRRLT